jgi:ribosomal protein L7/L12
MNNNETVKSITCAILLSILFCFASNGKVFGQDNSNLQKGEAIIAADRAAADAPKRRGADQPWVEISNLKKGTTGAFSDGIEFDYKVTEGSLHSLEIVIKSGSGISSTSITTFGRNEGKARLISFFSNKMPDNLELWVEYGGSQTPFNRTVGNKISKSYTLGSVGQITNARDWNEEEKKAYELSQKMKLPPPPPPSGYIKVDKTTQHILPGMPMLGAWMGEWHDAELLGVNKTNDFVSVKWLNNHTGRPAISKIQIDRTAISSTIQNEGRENPEKFKPSVKVLNGGLVPIDAGLMLIDQNLKLLPGTPLKAEWAGKWETVTVTAESISQEVALVWDNWKGWNEKKNRADLLIETSVLEQLQKSDAADFFAKRLTSFDKSQINNPIKSHEDIKKMHPKKYELTLSLPKASSKVKSDTFIPKGTNLGAVWGNKWHNLTVLSDSSEGPVECHWDGYPANTWNEWIDRDSLVIPDSELRKAQAALKKLNAGKPTEELTKKEANAGLPQGSTQTSTSNDSVLGSYELELTDVGPSKTKVAKLVMELSGVELKDAIDILSELPITLKKGLSITDAKNWQTKIEQAGGKANIKPGTSK